MSNKTAQNNAVCQNIIVYHSVQEEHANPMMHESNTQHESKAQETQTETYNVSTPSSCGSRAAASLRSAFWYSTCSLRNCPRFSKFSVLALELAEAGGRQLAGSWHAETAHLFSQIFHLLLHCFPRQLCEGRVHNLVARFLRMFGACVRYAACRGRPARATHPSSLRVSVHTRTHTHTHAHRHPHARAQRSRTRSR